MKICPTCQSQYTDDSLSFCLQDGTPLVTAGGSQMPTVAFGEEETIVSRPASNPVYRNTDRQNWQTNPTGRQTSQQIAPKSGVSFLTIFFIALTAVLLISFIGIGVWIFIFNGSPMGSTSPLLANANTQTSNKSVTASTPIPNATRPVSTPADTSANTNTASPVDKEQIKKDVSSRINNWKSNAEAIDLDSYMNNYGDTVDYYNKRGASRNTVRTDKQRAFSKYDSIKINLTDLTVTPDSSGNTAIAVFDKEWNFSDAGDVNSGKVRQQLTLKKIGGQWLITGEKDLKVYYTNK